MTEDLPKDTIIDLSQPGIIHRIYPSGREVPMEMMNPDIGGFLGAGNNDEM